MSTRQEKDSLGFLEVDDNVLWGIHTERARANFSATGRSVPWSLIEAFSLVKRAAAMTNAELGYLSADISTAICHACEKIYEGGAAHMSQHFPLDALQGDAGTSTNMNVNEVIANLALEKMGKPYGAYETIHPIHHVNLHGSTNDLYPTALRIAAISGVRKLSNSLARLQGVFQEKETAFSGLLKMGRTELQSAVPMMLGQEFSAFAEAVARDRWRTFKCEERLRIVNIGGTAIGTGIGAPREYTFRVIEVLRALTGMGLSRSENMIDATANADVFVEVSGILKACASTFAKIAADLRLLHFFGEIILPPVQAGSSIMPSKINPVMMENVMQLSVCVRSNDLTISECAAHGTLQINEFMPLIAWALLDSIHLLTEATQAMAGHVSGIEANREICSLGVENSPTLVTALLPFIGYEKSQELAREYMSRKRDSFSLTLKTFLKESLSETLVEDVLDPLNMVRSCGTADLKRMKNKKESDQ